ncbi:MAG: hypothetical protein JL50_05130 [Peptococcaceae bacterium BICA1-7]|nr:MAG: hypothetical protein JL50_05130 [Peptococcaceae bacterium BICA1-7]HBV96000.1 DUF2512 domain-containing protein [Desulfotomaculum sp.]
MSKTSVALIVKFVMTFVAAAIAFMILERNALGWVALVALAGTILNYLLGDLVILPRFGNIVASLGDGVLAAVTAYVVDLIVPGFTTTWAALAAFAVLVAVAEYFFHAYLRRSEKVAP